MLRPPPAPGVPLAPLTTLGVGGAAAALREAVDEAGVVAALDEAARAEWPVLVLGGGSNVLVADAGFPGMVLSLRGAVREDLGTDGDRTLLRVEAGHDWDELVAWTVAQDLAGIECLSGIPGRVGAAPLQNIGAYGQELAETLVAVEAVERATGARWTLPGADCGLGYRTSRFKEAEPDRFIVTAIVLGLRRGGAPALRYAELQRAVSERGPSLAEVRRLVRELRRAKSMLLDPYDPDARSAGSFFTNPVVPAATAAAIHAPDGAPAPSWPAPGGVKLAAAWLIEQAGFARGAFAGPAGLSTKHTLAIVNRGGATAADIVRVAATVRRGVAERFGVTLCPEPVFVGFAEGAGDAVLDAALGPRSHR